MSHYMQEDERLQEEKDIYESTCLRLTSQNKKKSKTKSTLTNRNKKKIQYLLGVF